MPLVVKPIDLTVLHYVADILLHVSNYHIPGRRGWRRDVFNFPAWLVPLGGWD